MTKKLIYKIFFLFIILSNFIYAEKMILRNGISEKTIDLVTEEKLMSMNEMRLKVLFEAIRKNNNKFVLNHLATRRIRRNSVKILKREKRMIMEIIMDLNIVI